ncbi:MAG: DUF285 domain-containing protein, partial [archaeon]|nr:DUF285 domain-containing protein [archaeon]
NYIKLKLSMRTKINKMNALFSGCGNLKNCDILRNFKYEKVEDLSELFFNCKSITSLNFNCFESCTPINLSRMLAECESLKTVEINKLNVEKVMNYKEVFYHCKSLVSLDLSKWNINKNAFNTMDGMFALCSELEKIKFKKDIFSKDKLPKDKNIFEGSSMLHDEEIKDIIG